MGKLHRYQECKEFQRNQRIKEIRDVNISMPSADCVGLVMEFEFECGGGGGGGGGFTPSRHLRPSSGREYIQSYTLIQSGDDDYLMNETRRKPTTGRQSPSLFDKWHGIFYMPIAQTRLDIPRSLVTQSCLLMDERLRTKSNLVSVFRSLYPIKT